MADDSDLEGLEVCADCRATFDPGLQRGYVFEDVALCAQCAARRGGVFDEEHDDWVTEPEVGDLIEAP